MTSITIRLLALEDDEVEEFIDIWAEGIAPRYHQVQRVGKANDKGRDVIGFLTPQKHEGDWHLYQCKRKQRGSKLGVPEMLGELGKMFFHNGAGAYQTLPVSYVFVSPRGVVGNVADLINHPSRLKQKLLDEWDQHCGDKITAKVKVPLSEKIRAAIKGYDFGRVSYLATSDLAKHPAAGPALTKVLGLTPGDAPTGEVPPGIQPEEMEYVDQLRQVYGEKRRAPFADADEVLADVDHGGHLRDQRTRFCDATAFLRFHRDSVTAEALVAFKDEVYHGAIDVHRDRHDSKLDRVNAVMRHASTTTPALNGKLARITVRQGMCHHLANEGKMKWGAMTDSFGHLFNSPLEAGIRAVAVLEKLRPETADLAEMVLFDHVVVHTADLDGPRSLHPDLPGRAGELLVRRRLVEASLDLMRRCHLVERESTPNGIHYHASQEAAAYLDLLESAYSLELKACAEWLAVQVRRHSKAGFKALARERIGNWNDAFSTLGGNAREA